MAILNPADDYPAIRASLDMTLTANDLSDEVISLPIHEGTAEAEVVAVDSAAASRTGDELQHIKNAVILITAALLAPIIPPIEGTSSYPSGYGRRETNVATQIANLRGRAAAELAAVLTPSETLPNKPTVFATVQGQRGR